MRQPSLRQPSPRVRSALTAALRPALCLALAAGSLVGCVNHIKPYTPKRRVYEAPVSTVGAQPEETGSVFDGNSVASRLMTDPRAQRENDLVIIVIDEQASAQRDTSTELGREDSYNTQLNDFLGLLKELESQNPNFNGAAAIDFAHKNAFKGQGKTTRNDSFKATVPAMVRRVLPNGTMFVEGHRVVLVNSEEHHFYISGVIRPEDIDGTGSVPSSRMADAQIEFVGRGNLTSGSGQGWFSRILDFIWPF
jgi:flagellar L-ring protein precursor FlgH